MELFLAPDTSANFEKKLKFQKRHCSESVYKWISENSRSLSRTASIIAGPFLLEHKSLIPSL